MQRSLAAVMGMALFVCVPVALALDLPARPGAYVTDQANVLSSQTESTVNVFLKRYEAQTSNQVMVVTLPNLDGEPIEDISLRLAETWLVGQKGKDNGIIFLIAIAERKMRIEVGYGLEGALPDALAGQIIRENVAPHFKTAAYEKGILSGLQAIIQATQGEYQGSRQSVQRGRRQYTPEELESMRAASRTMGIALLILVLILSVADGSRYWKYRRGHGAQVRGYSFFEWWFRFAILLFVINLIFKVLFYSMLFSRGGYYGSRGGFGGGGFSGGGGSFGGGGASGGW